MRSDYLDTSNPLRLKAFFMYCDTANTAADAGSRHHSDNPMLQSLVIAQSGLIRFKAIENALQLFNGGDFIIVPEY